MKKIKIDKKYLYIVAGIFGVFVLVIAIIAIAKACQGPGSDYEKVERDMVKAATKYFNAEGQELPKEFENKTVSDSDLATVGLMKPMAELLIDTSCKGEVTIYNYSGEYLYIPYLSCSEYKTNRFVDQVKKDSLIKEEEKVETPDEVEPETPEEIQSNDNSNAQTSNVQESNTNDSNAEEEEKHDNDYPSGLYQIGDRYVFRGKKPNNYVSFRGFTWRILDIDSNGIMRVIKSEPESRVTSWDTKFNSEVGKNYGINDYKNSYVLELMNQAYKDFNKDTKLHLAPYDVCIGKRGAQEVDVDNSLDCAEKLEHQYIGLVNASDYATASLDEHCTFITNGACTNYNYLTGVAAETWTSTGLKDNTYEVISVNGGVATKIRARKTAYYSWVIAFNSKEKFISGSGTAEDPYIFGEAVEK